MEKEKNFTNPEYYENRELSWLKFNSRVLYEAKDKTIPLLERLKFVGITSSNLDEFFMVRVASLKDMVHAGYKKKDIAGMTAAEQLEAINLAKRELVESQYFTYNRSMLPLLKEQNIEIIHIIIETLLEMLPEDDERRKLVSKDLITYVQDRKGHDRRYAIAPDKIKAEIGWEPETMFKEGIKKTIAWYFEHEDWMENVTSGDYQNYYNEMYQEK